MRLMTAEREKTELRKEGAKEKVAASGDVHSDGAEQ